MTKETNAYIATRASVITIIVNAALSALKLLAGVLGHSSAMVSDAAHSMSDVFSTVIVIIGVRAAGKETDDDHQYGHERFESVAALILAVLLAVTGLWIGYAGVLRLIRNEVAEPPSAFALAAAAVSVAVKELMFRYTRKIAIETGSQAMMASAWDHRSDAFSSIGSFSGVLGTRCGFPELDPLASVVICGFILKASLDIFREAAGKLTDKAPERSVVEGVRTAALAQSGVISVDLLKIRTFADKIYVDVEISADGEISLNEAHRIAESVHNAVETGFNAKHCMVHVNPR
ncbi:MAG: cation diffusion facilitator family transporter [Clostridiales bacterium]|jgi:cation diffusion facilitator family transporter|nr:cation diffusion facilitator family transporter [Clostridiales bacterium]